MSFFSPIRPLIKGWLCSFLVFGLVAAVVSVQMIGTFQVPPVQCAVLALRDWLPWAVLAPLIFRFVSRFPLRWHRLHLGIIRHIAVALAVLGICLGWAQMLSPRVIEGTFLEPPWFIALIFLRLPIFLGIHGIAHILYFYRSYEDGERRALSLEASLAKARLEALRMQIQPHFLFNSLNAIAELVHINPDAADDMLVALSDLLRLTLETSSEQELPLRRELEFVERYLAIEKVRFGARLETNIEAPREIQDAMVPAFLLQPLLENAVRHGIGLKMSKGIIHVSIQRERELLHLAVSDNGLGLSKKGPLRQGIGLTNTQARLDALYNGSSQFELVDSDQGLTVKITIPYKTA